MKILFVVSRCNLFKIDSGGANRNNLFVKALAKIGHVDIVSFSCENAISDIGNCNVIYSNHIARHCGYVESARAWLSMSLFPNNPYSYFRLSKERERIVDDFERENNYDIIACRYIENAITCGLLKYKDKVVIDVDENPENALRYQADQVKNFLLRRKKLFESKRIGKMVENLLDGVYCSFFSNQLECQIC